MESQQKRKTLKNPRGKSAPGNLAHTSAIKPVTELPQLPGEIQRKLSLQWEELLGKYKLTGGHLEWHKAEREYQENLAKQPPKPKPINSGDCRRYPRFTTAWVEPAVNKVGVNQTHDVAKERFQ